MRRTRSFRHLAGAALFSVAAVASAPSQAIVITGNNNAAALAAAVSAGATGLTVVGQSLQGHGAVGAAISSGTYTNASGTYGIGGGIVLSTGNVTNYNDGPNTSSGQSTIYAGGTPVAGPQETVLDSITAGGSHFDLTQLDITFTTSTGSVFFNVVFGSEEWPEFVGQFNDGFGLLLDGVNIASVGGSPVNIDHPDMAAVAGTQLDGILEPGTNPVLLFSASGLSIGPNHTLTFMVADTNDAQLDTTVYIASLGGTEPPPPPGLPEPGSLLLLGAALAGLAIVRRQRR